LLVTADLDAVRAAGPYDLVTSLFGVLSHIEGAENRINILNSIRSMLTREGLLLLTVPHALRRFPLHTSSAGRGREGNGESSVRTETRRYFPSARPVIYRRHVENAERPFPYYLFSRRGLTAELSAAGFALEILESDSILPERRLVRSPALAPVDDFLCRLLPSWAGYGLRAICRAGPQLLLNRTLQPVLAQRSHRLGEFHGGEGGRPVGRAVPGAKIAMMKFDLDQPPGQ